MFVCTGTEANDLAFRIARTVTGNEGAVVLEHAYHGNSIMVTGLSTEMYPAADRPDWLQAAEAPDSYRGTWRAKEPGWATDCADRVRQAMDALGARGHGTAIFINDNIYSSSGILTPPPEYLAAVYRAVRERGGLIVADEVQSGLCRLGDHYWGFQDSGVVPDIVTMGKPLGDGHPLAAVVTTPEIAASFARRFRYFNTFGGNPVSAAAGLAVLDVIEREKIRENVQRTGAVLRAGLLRLAERHEQIGDVRGKGLFYGMEIVRDRDSREPAAREAERIRESLRENGVLLGTTGPHGNVIKIRPPMVFSEQHAARLLSGLERALVIS
ncbi:MAG: aminotransferase class III-fold pyridoxal phosphate-dependent enzyme, partial [Gammaproteobacteria bacterium]|nr:aminotransferase class III-fold pyridoxal phosphate-dependent enzyme [Gammaproteobacteria bacterium]